MFTGLVTDLGRIGAIDANRGGIRLYVTSPLDQVSIPVGASIAHNGCCLTVVEQGTGWHAVDVSGETMARTTIGDWQENTLVNLERSLKLGDELGGHLVYGHIDGVATVAACYADGDSWRFAFDIPADLGRFLASKGSVALDGISLTVNEVDDSDGLTRFGVNIVPHTYEVTTVRTWVPGQRINFEADMLARYVARLTETRTR